jgi:4-hydroxy-3-polyprenylbenzoate decarboxylase
VLIVSLQTNFGNEFTNNPCSFVDRLNFMQKIAVAVTGASGAIYARVLLNALKNIGTEEVTVGMVWSDNAYEVWRHELADEAYQYPEFVKWDKNDFTAPIASGSSDFSTLIICPCSMGTLGRIAGGISNDLITRAADVMLKERRKLICVVRETPYNLVHLRNMTTVTEAGGIICPATPSFYSKPQTIEAVAATVVDRVLQLCNLPIDTYRWGSEKPV